MDEPDRSKPAGRPAAGASDDRTRPGSRTPAPPDRPSGEAATAAWVADLPPPPFVDPASPPTRSALRPAVPARRGADRGGDRHRPAALDGPRQRPAVRARPAARVPAGPTGPLAGPARRATDFAILIVYIVAFLAFVEFLNLTLTPLINELIRFIEDFPALVGQFQGQLDRLAEFYARLQIPSPSASGSMRPVAGIAQGGPGRRPRPVRPAAP